MIDLIDCCFRFVCIFACTAVFFCVAAIFSVNKDLYIKVSSTKTIKKEIRLLIEWTCIAQLYFSEKSITHNGNL